jgi:hypothetical protein
MLTADASTVEADEININVRSTEALLTTGV